jgi:cytochrome c556
MRKSLVVMSLLAATVASAAIAADDPIAVRKALMQGVGGAAGAAGGMMKEEIPYNPVVAKAAIASINASAQAFGDFFPEGTADDERTTASPKIWEDMAGFDTKLGELQAAAAAAVAASGKDGPADLDAFKAAMGPIFGTCKGCHETYRVQKN